MTPNEISAIALEKAITALQKGIATYTQALATETWRGEIDGELHLTEAGQLMRDGVIQRFEFTFDLARKLTKRTLFEIFKREEYDYRNDIWREAERFHLIADCARWINHHDNRNLTSHVYDEVISDAVFSAIENFIPDVIDCLNRINHETRK